MTRKDAIKLAQKAGFYITEKGDPLAPVFLHFAALVAEAEREACAKVCENIEMRNTLQGPADCAVAIRARGSK
jgi:hypothetical protein